MLPLKLLVAGALLILGLDYYELIHGVGSQGVATFFHELWTGEFSVVIAGFFLVYGLARGTEFRLVRWLFLGLNFVEGLSSVYFAFLDAGKTQEQFNDMVKTIPFWPFYAGILLPVAFSCFTRLFTAISFQMKKPYFYSFPPLSPAWTWACGIISAAFYLQTLIISLFFGILIAAHKG